MNRMEVVQSKCSISKSMNRCFRICTFNKNTPSKICRVSKLFLEHFLNNVFVNSIHKQYE